MRWLDIWNEVNRPRRPGEEASARKAVDGPTSPPRANPCTSRQVTASTGANTPMRA